MTTDLVSFIEEFHCMLKKIFTVGGPRFGMNEVAGLERYHGLTENQLRISVTSGVVGVHGRRSMSMHYIP